MDGVLNVLKPAGMTSHDAVYFLRWATHERKIGHTGTLDPEACGVLVCCLGAATRYIEYMEGATKSYRAEFQLGITTDTGDIWGTAEAPLLDGPFPSKEQVEQAAARLRGTQQQLPPLYSAVKVDGRPLYKYARGGEQMPQIASRTVEIHTFDLIAYDPETGRGTVDLTCSKGTYVRTLLEDLGKDLGTGAAMTFLLRTASGTCPLSESLTLEEIKEAAEEGQIDRLVHPIGYGLDYLSRITVRETRGHWFLNGGYLTERDCLSVEEAAPSAETEGEEAPESILYAVYGADGTFLGTARRRKDSKNYWPDKVRPNVPEETEPLK